MKYFFPKPAASSASALNADISVLKIKEQIRKLVDGEDPAHPLSDQKLADLLSKEKITISRRTVAKYRSDMDIPDTSRRRK